MLGVYLSRALRRFDWRLVLVAAWALFLLFPVWRTGFLGDDIFNSTLPGRWFRNGSGPFDQSIEEIQEWMFGVGRINPLIYFLKNYAFWLLTDLFWYKTALVGWNVVNLVLFYRLLKRLGASADLAALACILTAALFQFRIYNDPILGFNGLMQWLFLTTMLSLECFHRYLIGGGRAWLAGSVLCYLLAALTYELVYPFWLLHLALLLTTRPSWAKAAAVLPFAAIPLLLMLGGMWLRSRLPYGTGAYSIHLEWQAVAVTGLKQYVAALPGSYAGLDPSPLLRDVYTWNALRAHPAAPALGFAVGVLTAVGLARQSGARPPLAPLLVLGVLLMLLPVAMICPVRRYQDELHFGIAHLPVYVQYFGVALVLACGAAAWGGRLAKGRAATTVFAGSMGLLCAGVAFLDEASNARVTYVLHEPFLSPRRELEELLESGGLLSGVPAGAVVIADPYLWDRYGDGTFFYCGHSGIRLKEVVPSVGAEPAERATLAVQCSDSADRPPGLRVRYVRPAYSGGYAIAGTLRTLRIDADAMVRESGVNQVRLAVRRTGTDGSDQKFVFHAQTTGEDDASLEEVTLRPEQMRRTAETRNWTVYDVDLPCPMIDEESVCVEADKP